MSYYFWLGAEAEDIHAREYFARSVREAKFEVFLRDRML